MSGALPKSKKKCQAITESTGLQCKNGIFINELCRIHSKKKNCKMVVVKEPQLCKSKTKFDIDCRFFTCPESDDMCFYHFVVDMLEKHISFRVSGRIIQQQKWKNILKN